MRVATVITHLYLTLLQGFLPYFHVSLKEATAAFILFHSSFFFSLHIHFVCFLISYPPFPFYHFLSLYTVSNYVLLFAYQISINLPKGNIGIPTSSFYTL